MDNRKTRHKKICHIDYDYKTLEAIKTVTIYMFQYLSKKDGEQAFIDIVMADEFWQSSPSNIMSG